MTVEKLIEKLKQLPQDKEIKVEVIDLLGISSDGPLQEVYETSDGQWVNLQSV